MKFATIVLAGFAAGLLTAIPCEARVARIVIDQVERSADGQYEILRCRAFGTLDRAAPGNAIITDRQFAPRNAQGRVEYGRMVAFAVAAVQGRASLPGARPWTNIKELVATTPDSWEISSRPR